MSKSDQISVIAELERIGYAFNWASENEIKCLCPFHEDSSPSCNINTQKRIFKCHVSGCGAHGDFISFLAGALKTTRATVYAELSTRYVFDSEAAIDPQVIERYHEAIWSAKPLLQELYNRGVTDKIIRARRLGERDGRIMIPIVNRSGIFVNIRKYLPGAPGKDKMRNMKGRGKLRLYPIEQLEYDDIVITGGEVKAIVGAEQLNKKGIGCIAPTGGEGNWDQTFTAEFANKRVWICDDIDDEGQKGAMMKCASLYRTATSVHNIILPLDKEKYPHGDINDFVGLENGKLYPLLKKAIEWKPIVERTIEDTVPEKMELIHAIHAKNTGKRIEVKAIVTTIDDAPYIIPKDVAIECEHDQNECMFCPVHMTNNHEMTIHPESAAILELMGEAKGSQRGPIMRGLFIPETCKTCRLTPVTYYNIEDCRLSPQLEVTNRTADRVMQPAACIGNGLDLNEPYLFTGRMFPHPKTQQSTLLMSKYTATQDALGTYKCENLDDLKIFQPSEWTVEGIEAQLDRVYDDLEANVTRIFKRRDMHLIVDLTYHSPLHIKFDGKIVKGWVESLIVGDSAQGKSEVTCGSEGNGGLMSHYRLGEKVECKNASVAGLLGGCQMVGGKRWFVTWGIIPTHDKRLVVLEELKGASQEVIGKLTDMRSSGIAEIPKIEKRRTHARTRLIALSNPRGDRTMSTHNFGVEAIKELVGSLEDIRRFDVFYIVNRNDVDASELNKAQKSRPYVPHDFTSDLCRSLILWAWTRTPDQVIFEQDASTLVLEEATKLSNEYSDQIPILDRGSARYKLGRLASSLACRTFSTDNNHQNIVVRACHVQYIAQTLRRIYSSHSFGYLDYTSAIKLTQEIVDPDAIKKKINETSFPCDLVNQLLHTSRIELSDLQDWCAWDREQAQGLLSFFVRKRAFQRDGRFYRKTPAFIRLLKDLQDKNEIIDRPSFIDEEF
jgi:hypothetical protein